MLDPKMVEALNTQINQEFAASYSYVAMAAWLDAQHLRGFASFFEKQADEERAHAQKILRYLLDRDGELSLEAISKPKADFESVECVFSESLAQEQRNTNSINQLYALARDLDDYTTQAHLQWFLDEQVEEESLIGDLLGKLRMAAGDKSALLILDEQSGKRPAPTSADTGLAG